MALYDTFIKDKLEVVTKRLRHDNILLITILYKFSPNVEGKGVCMLK
jgi:hypothetical protein